MWNKYNPKESDWRVDRGLVDRNLEICNIRKWVQTAIDREALKRTMKDAEVMRGLGIKPWQLLFFFLRDW